jgi:hypothetical protein
VCFEKTTTTHGISSIENNPSECKIVSESEQTKLLLLSEICQAKRILSYEKERNILLAAKLKTLESAHDALGDEIRRAVQIIQTSTNGDVVLGSPEEVAATLQSLKALKETCKKIESLIASASEKVKQLE